MAEDFMAGFNPAGDSRREANPGKFMPLGLAGGKDKEVKEKEAGKA